MQLSSTVAVAVAFDPWPGNFQLCPLKNKQKKKNKKKPRLSCYRTFQYSLHFVFSEAQRQVLYLILVEKLNLGFSVQFCPVSLCNLDLFGVFCLFVFGFGFLPF